MNKKIISSFVVLAIIFNVSSVCFSAEKKDVTDPVLREMINSLSTKMPKFINQYGSSVFVADEKVTRGALIKALYEYDKKNSGGSAAISSDGDLTKKQYTALSNRISALERNSSSTTGKASAKSGSYDVVTVMNDLEPNMPMLLDNTLMQSKVFRDLQRKVNLVSNNSVSSEDSTPLSKTDAKTVAALKKQVAMLNKKVDNFEASSSAGNLTNKEYNLLDTRIAALEKNSANVTGKETSSPNDAKVILALRKQVAILNKKVDAFETSSSEGSLTNKEYSLLDTRIAALEKNSANVTGKETSSPNDAKVILALRKQVAILNKKVDAFETSSSAGNLTNKEYNLLDTRIAALEKNSTSVTGKETSSPNDAKVMLALRKQVSELNKKIDNFEQELASASKKDKNLKTDELAEMSASLKQIQKSYVAMSKRVNELESNQSALTASASPSGKDGKLSNAQMKNINLQIASIKKTVENIPTNDYVDAEIQKANMQTAKDIKKIEQRLNDLGKSRNVNSGSSSTKSDSEGSSTAGTIAKVSLGLTMIAALFIAR